MIKFQDDFYVQVSNKFDWAERARSRENAINHALITWDLKKTRNSIKYISQFRRVWRKRIKKAKQAGFNVGIKNFDETNFFRKPDWRVKRIKKEKDNEIKKLSDENDNLNIDKSNLQHELDMSKIELSDAYSQRNEASRKIAFILIK